MYLRNHVLGRLHIGEVEVIIGAVEKCIQSVVLDDLYARNKAKQFDLTVTGTLGVLMKAKKTGWIDDLSNDIENLKKAGMYISSELIAKIISI